MKTDIERSLPPDIYLIRIPETEYWDIEDALMRHVERLETVFMFDRNEQTCCCEITPSYCLIPIETRPVFKPHVYALPDCETILEAIFDLVSRNSDTDCKYHHCRVVDRLIEKAPDRFYHYGDTKIPYTETPYEEQLENLEEYFRSNERL